MATESDNYEHTEMPLLKEEDGTLVLFHPFIAPEASAEVASTLSSRWIGEGPKVKLFEKKFSEMEGAGFPAIATGAGTDALHIAYKLCGLTADSEVIAPLFTCTATNIPLLHERVKIRFVDVMSDSLNMDASQIRGMINKKTKAIVCVHYGGLPCDLDELSAIEKEYGIPVIQDGAHSLGLRWRGLPMSHWSRYTMYSFQAIKHITTGDGGMLIINDTDASLIEKAKRLRWFGIEREKKLGGVWGNDIKEIGYKYQMTDVAASIGLAALPHVNSVLQHRRNLLSIYEQRLRGVDGVRFFSGAVTGEQGYEHGAWLCTILAEKRKDLQKLLYDQGIESNQVHYRNDRYSIFRESAVEDEYPNMDRIQNDYLVLPLHNKITVEDVHRICDLISKGW